jgi:hypothetical protein
MPGQTAKDFMAPDALAVATPAQKKNQFLYP